MEEKQIPETPPADVANTPSLDAETISALKRVAYWLERGKFGEYVTYMSKPRQLIFANLTAGLMRGLGFTLGATVLVAGVFYLMGRMVDIPLIGHYIAKIVRHVQHEIGNHPF